MSNPFVHFEADVIEGLKPFAQAELERELGAAFQQMPASSPTAIPFIFRGDWARLNRLRTVSAVYVIAHFPIPRPKALLAHQHWQTLLRLIAAVRQCHPPDAFRTCHISAAGDQTSVFRRIQQTLAADTGLTYDDQAGDLWLRVRPAPAAGWQALLRLTPRPLAARPWRVQNLPGALSAPVAAVMGDLTQPQPTDRFLNLTCGSGTLLVERLLAVPASLAVGTDHNLATLRLAQANLDAAGVTATLLQQDDAAPALAAGAFDAIVADLPWGQLVGETAQMPAFYPQLFAAAARLARPAARFVLITHLPRLVETLLSPPTLWQIEHLIRLRRENLHPRIYVLRRLRDTLTVGRVGNPPIST